ncbi:TIGR02186 family protein, partial [Sinorhizobium meliloti]
MRSLLLHSLVALVLAVATPAAAQVLERQVTDFTEKLEIGISTEEIAITSDFRGA